MKKLLLIALSSIFFLSLTNEISAKEMSSVERMEKRLTELNLMLEKKEKEREKKSLSRELKRKKLDDNLREKSRLREESNNGYNAEEIKKALKG